MALLPTSDGAGFTTFWHVVDEVEIQPSDTESVATSPYPDCQSYHSGSQVSKVISIAHSNGAMSQTRFDLNNNLNNADAAIPELISGEIHLAGNMSRSLDDYFEYAHSSTPLSLWERRKYILIFLSMGLANIGDSAEIGLMSFLLTDQEFKENILKGDIAHNGAIFTGSIYAGMLVGSILTGMFGDQIGRRPNLLMGLTLNAFSGLCGAMSSSITMLAFFRFLGGLGVGAILSSIVPLATELSPPSRRGGYVTFVNAFMPIGGLYVGGLAMFMLSILGWSWRSFVVGCTIPSVLGIFAVYLHVPESARYLALKGRHEEAVIEANKVADAMGHNDLRFSEAESRAQFETESQNNDDGIEGFHGSFQEALADIGKSLKVLYSEEMKSKTIAIQALWFFMSFGSGFGTWILAIFDQLNLKHLYVFLFIFWLANIPGLAMAAMVMDWVGRKKLLSLSLKGSVIALLSFAKAVTEESDYYNYPFYVLLSSFMFHMFLVMAWSATACISSESFPTKFRTTGLGLATASGRVGVIIVQFVDGYLLYKPALLVTTSAAMMICGLGCLYFLTDTSNIGLKDDIISHSEQSPSDTDEADTATNNFEKPNGESTLVYIPLEENQTGTESLSIT